MILYICSSKLSSPNISRIGPNLLSLCNLPFHPPQKKIRRPAITGRLQSRKSPKSCKSCILQLVNPKIPQILQILIRQQQLKTRN